MILPSRDSRSNSPRRSSQRPNDCSGMQQIAAAPEPFLHEADRVLAADRPAGLARGPGRERAPVRALAGAPRDLRGEQRVGVRDLEVAQDRVADRDDPPDLFAVSPGAGPDHRPERLPGQRHGLEVVDVRHRDRDAVEPGVEVRLDLLGDLVRGRRRTPCPGAVGVGGAGDGRLGLRVRLLVRARDVDACPSASW